MISVGIDSGSATTKAVLINCNHIAAQVVLPTAFDFLSASEKAYKNVLANSGIAEEDVNSVYATGYGQEQHKICRWNNK